MMFSCKAFPVKDLKQITVIGLGLLGGSITLEVLRSFPRVKVVGYSHRPSTRQKARDYALATEIVDDITESVSNADLVILATPIFTFEKIFTQIAEALPKGCIVTDVGSTKILPHRWAAKRLPKTVHYVGSHPIAGSEQRGLEFARDDLFDGADCIITTRPKTNKNAFRTLKNFWSQLGCLVQTMTPAQHDKTFAGVSHLPHIAAVAITNAADPNRLKFAGKGFLDTSRVASGPANIWTDILLTNIKNCDSGIDKLIDELKKLQKAIKKDDRKQVETLLEKARAKRTALINYKIKKKELIL